MRSFLVHCSKNPRLLYKVLNANNIKGFPWYSSKSTEGELSARQWRIQTWHLGILWDRISIWSQRTQRV